MCGSFIKVMSSLEPQEVGAHDKQNINQIDACAHNAERFDLYIKGIRQVQRSKQRKARNQKQVLYFSQERKHRRNEVKEHPPCSVRNAKGLTICTGEGFST